MATKCISYEDQGIELEGFAAYPADSQHPLVILCHAWSGRNEYICEQAERLAALGFACFAIDVYGKGVIGKSDEENGVLKRTFVEDRLLLQRRLLKGYETACALPSADTGAIAAVGYGFGGMCALDLARSGVRLQGAVSVYGHFDPPVHSFGHPIKSKILILHGFNDPVATLADLHAFEKEMDRHGVDWQSHVFGNTYHAFASPSAQNPSAGLIFQPDSARRAHTILDSFLKDILKSSTADGTMNSML